MSTPVRIQPLAASTAMLAAEHARLAAELWAMEQKMAAVRTGTEAQTLEQQVASHRAALAELERAQEAERQAAREAAEAERKELLQGRARELVQHEDARLAAIGEAEAHLMMFVGAINKAFSEGQAVRAVAGEIAAARGFRLLGFSSLSGSEFEARIAYAVSAHLSRVEVKGRLAGGRIGSLQLVGATLHPTEPGSWAERERGKAAADVADLLEREGVIL